ncbi:IclR family transcriptional regulator, partial [Mesorhizobium sp. M4A.F.Ca.ET.050.02.1.1]
DAEAQAHVRRRGFILPRNYARSGVTNEQELLVELQRVRKHGYAVSADESVVGITALATPIADRQEGPAVGSVSVAGPSVRMPSSRFEAIAIDLVAAAKELSEIWPLPRVKKVSAPSPA